MEGNFITIALIGSPDTEKNTLFHGLIQHPISANHALDFPVPRGTYHYRDEEYLLLNLPEITSLSSSSSFSSTSDSLCFQDCRKSRNRKSFRKNGKFWKIQKDEQELEDWMMQLLSSGRADILLVLCSAFCLEQGLILLSQLLKLPVIKEQAVPTVFCISFNDEAAEKGMGIDLDLLEDVLQIPVLPCYKASPAYIDDIKTAISAVWNHLFSYECLDFSPKKLAEETTFWLPPKICTEERDFAKTGYPKPSYPGRLFLNRLPWEPFSLQEKINLSCMILSLFLLLLWLILTGAHVPSLCLWRILYWIKKRIGIVIGRGFIHLIVMGWPF